MSRAGLALLAALASCGPPPAGPTTPAPALAPSNRVEPDDVKPREPVIDPAVVARVKRLWLELPASEDSCGDFDYFPGGGMKSFACHLDFSSTLVWLTRAWGKALFVDGPHQPGHLDLDNDKSFGHYNPELVRWLVDHLVPAATDPAFRERTQAIYDQQVRPLATIFDATYKKLQASPECRDREVARYQALLDGPGVPPMDYERYFFFMNPKFCDNPDGDFDYFHARGFDGGFDGNVVKTCTAFWIRRTIDGTAATFYEGLEKLRNTYEPRAK
jgi:hypothetical protein